MADAIQNQLDRAFNLIQQEKLAEALTLLRQVISAQPGNADAWWLMANAVTEPQAAFDALSNVLRLNPLHEDAREAYDQLVAEFPHFVAPTASADEFSADVPVDIDDLLRRTGPLDQRRNDPLSRPQDGIDVSSAYLDEIWEQRQTAGASPAGENADLDALFGGGAMRNVPATPTEEEDLTALFSGRAPRSPDDGLREEDLDEDVSFTEEDFAVEASEEEDLAKFFTPDIPDDDEVLVEAEETVAAVVEPEPVAERKLDDFFSPTDEAELDEAADETGAVAVPVAQPLFDPFAEREPQFVEAAASGDAAPAEPKARRERRARAETPAPMIVTGPLGPEDLERPINRRRSPLPRLLLLVAAIAIVLFVVYLFLSQNQPVSAPGPAAAEALNVDLRDAGYQEASSAIENGVLQVEFCALPGPDLQSRAYEAMSKIAARAAEARDQVQNAQIEVKTCGADQVLYRASAPISALTSFVDSAGDARTFRASWQPN
jgi:hypothetical protein